MKIIDIVRLIRKHIVLLVVAPLLLAILVILLTWNPRFIYASQTTLYTGLATGSTVEMEKSFNFSATNSAFDNLINVIKSRETLQEVAIRLLSQHLLLGKYDPKYISSESYDELHSITPSYIYNLVADIDVGYSDMSLNSLDNESERDSWTELLNKNEIYKSDVSATFPSAINKELYEKTVEKLTQLMKSSDTNFVYELLNYEHPHYSLKALSELSVVRMGNSDLVKVEYKVDDPGICQQTLEILNEVCIKNYKRVREARSDEVLKYFETQVNLSSARLKSAEDKLLEFNSGNSFINYGEQSRAVASSKEELEAEYNRSKVQLAGVEASIKRLEERLGTQQQIQLKNSRILEMKRQLGNLIYNISNVERYQPLSQQDSENIADLKKQSELLKAEIKREVDELYAFGKTTDGLAASTISTEWINNVVEAENIKGRLLVMEEQIKAFNKQYASYLPAGANIKRIEREISVSEQQLIENLHGLNLAKLKLQDNELASNIKTVDPPFYPLSPIPTKRKILVIAAALLGGIIILSFIFVTEFFDETLKNPVKSSGAINLPFAGVMPKIFLKAEVTNFPFIINRLIDITIQNIEFYLNANNTGSEVKTLLFFSTLPQEGKTKLIGNIARTLVNNGKKVLVLNYSEESLLDSESNRLSNKKAALQDADFGSVRKEKRFPTLYRILGYHDPRIDKKSTFLENPSDFLPSDTYFTYKVDGNFKKFRNYTEILLNNGVNITYVPDFVLIELPPVLYYNYPADLFREADISLLVCRSNRVWSDADKSAIEILSNITNHKIHFILNGVELNAIESVLGELPKKRSHFRKKMKNLFTFQFFSGNQL